MGFLTDVMKAVDDYGRRHKEHMMQQWEKQAEKAKASEPQPLTETQLVWQQLQQERAQQQTVREHSAAAPASRTSYTVTWQIRLTSPGSIPLPWATN